jgi:hypothetical protein
VHSPRFRRIRPLPALKDEHNIWRTGKKMRSGQYAAASQDAEAGGGVAGVHIPVCLKRPGRPDLDVYRSHFEASYFLLGPPGSERLFIGYNDV